ncbi:MAG: asparagine synthetase [Nitrososphaerota archaeon]|nr:asparagine synthetase [Nitrososphaerota archaeon]
MSSAFSELPKPLHELSEKALARKRLVARVGTRALSHLTGALTGQGFEWMLPVVFSKSTDPLWPDPGASIEKRVETEVYGETVRTTSSMIIHKLVACSTAYPKLFVLSPNVRVEKRERSRTGWHSYEFTQLDFEMREASSADVKRLVESIIVGLVASLSKELKDEFIALGRPGGLETPGKPFPTYDSKGLATEYGKDWERELVGSSKGPFWVTNIPREFYDFEDPKTGVWDNYDLFVPGYGEILSGARREWDYGRILAKIERDGVRKENYALLLGLASEGRLKPSAGGGIGLERLVTWLTASKHIGDVQPFPKVPGLVYDL